MEIIEGNYEKEIVERERILQKAHTKEKILPEERQWLLTHSVYHLIYKKDAFASYVERLEAKKWYKFTLTVEDVNYNPISILLMVAWGKGKIIMDAESFDKKGNSTTGKPVSGLEFHVESCKSVTHFDFYADLGFLTVEYKTMRYVPYSNIHLYASSGSDATMAIKRVMVDNHTAKYFCKSPISESFDALIFSLSWREKDEKPNT